LIVLRIFGEMQKDKINIWWGPPRKFSRTFEERKISWLELFYDLVYVIAISKITFYFSQHFSLNGLLDYTYLFAMIFWGWLNGSLHHDIHGSTGIRTNLMTLWQMMIVAALVVTFGSPPETFLFNATVAVMAMQLFITYLWWSVGIYDKQHRILNRPYTICFLISLGLMFITLFAGTHWIRLLFYTSLLLNYLPPFLANRDAKAGGEVFILSASMTERLGLFCIILFGEVVLGVVNGIASIHAFGWWTWVHFVLAILIVFSLWWIFFSMIADRKCKTGFLKSTLMSMVYIPAFMSLGVMGVAFSGLFADVRPEDPVSYRMRLAFGVSVAVFLGGIATLTYFLLYPEGYRKDKGKLVACLMVSALLFLVPVIFSLNISLFAFLLSGWVVLLLLILAISKSWLALEVNKRVESETGQLTKEDAL
jgi:low temperature requirement protein LtrA